VSDRAEFVSRRLAAAANPDKAVGMAAYMYGRRYQAMYPDPDGQIPYLGVQKPARVPIMREMLQEFPVETAAEYRAAVLELWTLPHREERYLAVGIAGAFPEYQRYENIDLYRRLIVEGAWWDFVDDLAARCVGTVLLVDRAQMRPHLDRWITDDDVWLRRTAVIAHLKHKDQTDVDQLVRHCLLVADEREFFIRKAIGWALREYAKTDPQLVGEFLVEHRDKLSGLSFREASKHLDLS
jgi:3-methyladenine DNA glycosylase AlkD